MRRTAAQGPGGRPGLCLDALILTMRRAFFIGRRAARESFGRSAASPSGATGPVGQDIYKKALSSAEKSTYGHEGK